VCRHHHILPLQGPRTGQARAQDRSGERSVIRNGCALPTSQELQLMTRLPCCKLGSFPASLLCYCECALSCQEVTAHSSCCCRGSSSGCWVVLPLWLLLPTSPACLPLLLLLLLAHLLLLGAGWAGWSGPHGSQVWRRLWLRGARHQQVGKGEQHMAEQQSSMPAGRMDAVQ
jgi:hypothetical protein